MGKKFLLFLVAFVGFITAQTFGQSDSLVFYNGDHLIGELKDMNRGVLVFETDYSDSDFKIEWDQIKLVYVYNYYLITISNGEIINGQFRSIDADSIEIVDGLDGKYRVLQQDIVYIKKVEKDFWSRLDASIDIGFSFTKAQNVNQINGRSSLEYLANTWLANGFYNSVLTSQDSVPTIRRNEGEVSFRKFLRKDYFVFLSTNFLSNTEQRLDLRTTGQLGVGKYFVHSNRAHVSVGGGGAYVAEQFFDSETENRRSWEVFVGAEINLFDIGDFSLKTTAIVFPSLTQSGRARVNYNFDAKYDLPLDFYISLGYSLNFDNEPAQGAARTDYVIQSSIGWEW
jgi:hypothetical protein